MRAGGGSSSIAGPERGGDHDHDDDFAFAPPPAAGGSATLRPDFRPLPGARQGADARHPGALFLSLQARQRRGDRRVRRHRCRSAIRPRRSSGSPRRRSRASSPSNFLPLENAVLEQNALIVNTGEPSGAVRHRHGQREGFRPDHRQAAQQHEAGRHRSEGHRRGGDEPRSHRPSAAAMSATTARATSRMRSSTSSSPISNSGPTRSWPADR